MENIDYTSTTSIDISIVIVNYNVKNFLNICIKSIEKAKKEFNIEIIVVDNASIDGSVQFINSNIPNVHLIALNQNLGFSKANNIGINQAKGKYTLILNPDTILDENTLFTMYDFMENNNDVGISGCKVLNADGSFQVACRRGFPTPWAAFCKLFGLQSLFPNIKIFSKYNQTYLNPEATYEIDSIMGAFMFAKTKTLLSLNGFDEDFFMYGEDIDLCKRAWQNNWKVTYVHSASIVHYKGESTKRSDINDIKHFYEAMKIYVKKHSSLPLFFLFFIKIGILLRSSLAYIIKFKLIFYLILSDIIFINFSILYATKIHFERWFGFPDYAYPTVFIVITFSLFITQFLFGDYFEFKPIIRKFFFGLLVNFFFLSSLTYFFKEFAFSRGVLLMTVTFTFLFSIINRILISIFDKISGKAKDKRILIIGNGNQAKHIIESIQMSENINTDIIGLVTKEFDLDNNFNIPVLGSIENLNFIIEKNNIQEVVICDENIAKNKILEILSSNPIKNVRFHVAQGYDELLSSRIINEINYTDNKLLSFNIAKYRYKFIKRILDVFVSIFLLSFGLPFLYLFFGKIEHKFYKFWNCILGKFSIIGIYSDELKSTTGIKSGIIGLVHISKPERLSNQILNYLNNYYIQNCDFSLDLDIFLKYIFRK